MKSKPILLLTVFLVLFSPIYSQIGNQSGLFFGGDSRIEIPNHNDFNPGNGDFTIEAWINPCEVNFQKTVVSKFFCSNGSSYSFSILNSKITFGWGPNGNCPAFTRFQSNQVLISSGVWAHIAIVKTSNSIQLYHNGQPVSGSFTQGSGVSPLVSSTEKVTIGSYRMAAGNYDNGFSGRIDEVRVWNVARTSNQIANNYQNVLSGSDTGLVAYYNFEQINTLLSDSLFNNGLLHQNLLNGVAQGSTHGKPTLVDNTFELSNYSLGNDTTVCLNSPYVLDGGYSGLGYAWSTNDTSKSIQIYSAGFYSVTVSLAQCTVADTIQVFSDSALCGSNSTGFCYKKTNNLIGFDGGGSLTGSNNYYGTGVVPIGDLNNDGNTDIAVSAYQYGGKGGVFVHFLDSLGGIINTTILSSGQNGIPSLANDARFGTSIDTIGDFNNDGTVDLVIGAMYDYQPGFKRGAAYIVFLDTNGTAKSYTKIGSGTSIFANEIVDGHEFGRSVINLGDVDGNGHVDIGVGAWYADDSITNSGAAYVIYLNALAQPISYFKIGNQTPGFNHLLKQGSYFGFDLARINDIDNNGYRDIGVTSIGDDYNGTNSGAFFFCLLNSTNSLKEVIKYNNSGKSLPFAINPGDYFGDGIFYAGDINNDGFNEMFISSPFADDFGSNSGNVYLLSFDNNLDVVNHQTFSRNNSNFLPFTNPNDRFGFDIHYSENFSSSFKNMLFISATGSDSVGSNNGFVIATSLIDSCIVSNCFFNPIQIFDTICDYQTYFLPSGKSVYLSGHYVDTLVNSIGCDSVFYIDLLINLNCPCLNYFNMQQMNLCVGDSFQTILGKIISGPGVYFDSLLTFNGCDSVIGYDVKRSVHYYNFQSINVCPGGSVILPSGIMADSAGTYYSIFTSYTGCDSTIETAVNYYELPNPSLGSDTTVCINIPHYISPGSFQTYLWDDGSTDSIKLANSTKNYSVTVTDLNECENSSDINIVIDYCGGMESIDADSKINIYPNPINNKLFIEVNKDFSVEQIDVYDISGRKLISKTFNESQSRLIELDFSSFSNGIYFLTINHSNQYPIVKSD